MLSKKDLLNIERMFDFKFKERFEEKFEDVRSSFKNDVLGFKVEILSELDKIRTDLDIVVGRLYDHEDRIQSLEKHHK